MTGSTEGTSDRTTSNDRFSSIDRQNQQLFGYLASAQRKVGPLDISTNEGKMLREAGWLDDRGFINEQGISKNFVGSPSKDMGSQNRS